jgi:hypothetical protein
VQIVETFFFASSVQYWESFNGWWSGMQIERRCISALSSIRAFQKCAVYLKTKGLLVNDIKQAFPSVQTIVHSKWLMVNGGMEEIQEGEGRHQCYRVYRHDMDYTEGKNVWVQFTWDKKCKLVLELLFVMPAFLQQWVQIKTAFLRY